MESNGSIYIKLGQHLSSMHYLLPTEWTRTFIPLQDHCPVSSYELIEDMFQQDIGSSIKDVFDDFTVQPIAAASLAQVHLAILKSTKQKVAVKLQHPILEKWVPLDLALLKFSFKSLKYFFPEYDLEWLSDEMETSLPQELDFKAEAKYTLQTKKHFSALANSPLLVPDVHWSSKRILVMDYIAGQRLDNLEYLDTNGIDRDEVSAALANIFNEMIFGDTLLHCDPHGGNIAIRKNERRRGHNFDIILYDHGLYRDIPKELRRDYAKLWLAVLDRNEQRMRQCSAKVAGVNDEEFPLFASVITGRDYLTETRQVTSERSKEEKRAMSGALEDGLLANLIQLLGKIPRTVSLVKL